MNTLKIDTSNSLITKIELLTSSKPFKIEENRKSPSDQNVLEVIDKILKKSRLKLEEVNSIQIKTGPGSFTGLRVGASIANALSFALGIPVNKKNIGEIVNPEY